MWGLYQNSKLWGTLPSKIMGVKGKYRAYCFDEAVSTWGTFITNELEKIEGKSDKEVNRKRRNKLMLLLQVPDEQRFRKPKKG